MLESPVIPVYLELTRFWHEKAPVPGITSQFENGNVPPDEAGT